MDSGGKVFVDQGFIVIQDGLQESCAPGLKVFFGFLDLKDPKVPVGTNLDLAGDLGVASIHDGEHGTDVLDAKRVDIFGQGVHQNVVFELAGLHGALIGLDIPSLYGGFGYKARFSWEKPHSVLEASVAGFRGENEDTP